MASVGVVAPVVLYLVAGGRAERILDERKVWLTDHDAVVTVLLTSVRQRWRALRGSESPDGVKPHNASADTTLISSAGLRR